LLPFVKFFFKDRSAEKKMPVYKAPLKDINFVIYKLLNFPNHYQQLKGCTEVTTDLTDAIINQAAKFSEQVLSPLSRGADEEGCVWSENGVTSPPGFKNAYHKYVEAGWPLLAIPEKFGGQGLPDSLNVVINELVSTANVSWSGYAGLSHGAIKTLMAHGSVWQQEILLPDLVTGNWTGTMCLTESHCGSDLGQLRTKAEPNRSEPNREESFSITGTKTFISCGEHDVAENIIHIVLARLPDAPEGTRGISLFAVPKFLLSDNGAIGERNNVRCGSIEKKMGMHGFVTCEMNFDGAKGYLIGQPNKGLACMFTFMNTARLSAGMQGLVHAEVAYQGAVTYAHERLAMRSLSGVKNPQGPADPIIVHPDVRRMLFTIKAISEGCRAFAYYLAQQVDLTHLADTDEEKQQAENLLSLLTPICKGFMTELGCEAAHLGVQVFGGHGYIREWGMEQNQRDCRISTLYEGTTGIQGLDLLGRKVIGSKGELLRNFTNIINKYCNSQKENKQMNEFIEPLVSANQQWGDITMKIGTMAMQDPEEVGAASVDYLMLSGYTVLAYFWARIAEVTIIELANGTSDIDFYKGKLHTARFYFQRLLPRTETLKITIASGAKNLMAMDADCFSLH